MAKVVFIGAGSFVFTRNIIRDLLTFDSMQGAELALVDIHAGRLEYTRKTVEKIIALGNYNAKVTTTTERTEALKGADAVIITILCGKTNVWQHDILIPKKYGIDINVGDTRGPAGIFRALRTIPTMLDICRDIEKLCPEAVVLNYTNPMAMLCHAMQRKTGLKITGLCHSVQGTIGMLAGWMGMDVKDVDYTCAGLNHLAWYTRITEKKTGKDLIGKLRKIVATKKKIYNEEQVRNEMFLQLGYYVTESSGHNSEYNWWFRKREDLIKKYCTSGTGWNPGEHAYVLKIYREREKTWRKEATEWLKKDDPISLDIGIEYGGPIINAVVTDQPFEFNGNVPNTKLITNLPDGCCVEVPIMVRKRGLCPIHVGDLPASVTPITSLTAQCEMMAVEGAFTGDAEMVYHAIVNDPLTAAKLSMAEARKMTAEMFKKNKPYLPQFKNIKL